MYRRIPPSWTLKNVFFKTGGRSNLLLTTRTCIVLHVCNQSSFWDAKILQACLWSSNMITFTSSGTLQHIHMYNVYIFFSMNLILGVKPCNGLVSHPGGSRNTVLQVASCYRNRDKLWPDGPKLSRMLTLP